MQRICIILMVFKGAPDERRQDELQQHVIDECQSLLLKNCFGSTPGLRVEDCRITSAAGKLSSLSPPPVSLVVTMTFQYPLLSDHSDGSLKQSIPAVFEHMQRETPVALIK
jgi:hypothetical protein